MDKYISAKEVAVKWGVSSRWVTVLCSQGKLNGAVKEKNRWMLPEDITRPIRRDWWFSSSDEISRWRMRYGRRNKPSMRRNI